MAFASIFNVIILFNEEFLFSVAMKPHHENTIQGQDAKERILD